MEFNYFDIGALSIIILLGLKGIINGFFKEIFGLIGIIGGIFIASRIGSTVGKYISDLIFHFENSAAISFTGFLFTLGLFWLLMILIGLTFKKLSAFSGLGVVDKILGFVFGASKFFLIVAVLAHAAYNIKIIHSSLENSMKTSILFPILVSTGAYIMKLDSVNLSNADANASMDESAKQMQEKINETIDKSSLEIVNEAKQKIKSQAESH